MTNQTCARAADFEALIADLSSRFANLPAGDIDLEIEIALQRICVYFGIDLAVLWQWSAAPPGSIVPSHYHDAEKGLEPPRPLDEQQFHWYVQQMLAGRLILTRSLESLPAQAAVDRESCALYNVRAALWLPLAPGGEPPVGALGLNTLGRERDWPDAASVFCATSAARSAPSWHCSG
ncbi:hypothetical protein [Thiocapsa rosea]|uniref:hypothetical protein n=1 Tax=Thiocapsa rosea TaxID=69360 RepID=UPI0011C3C102|nr:hypothetical protein [Thiocapsa rosea]